MQFGDGFGSGSKLNGKQTADGALLPPAAEADHFAYAVCSSTHLCAAIHLVDYLLFVFINYIIMLINYIAVCTGSLSLGGKRAAGTPLPSPPLNPEQLGQKLEQLGDYLQERQTGGVPHGQDDPFHCTA